MFRTVLLALALLALSTALAQSVHQARHVAFTLYHRGVLIPPAELQVKPRFHFRMDGAEVRPRRVTGTERSVVQFDAERSDPMLQKDTLWMEIVHDQERMRIAFPPPFREGQAMPYVTSNLHIDFAAGTFMAHELPLDVQVRGRLGGLPKELPMPVRGGLHLKNGRRFWHRGTPDARTGAIDAEVACVPYYRHGRQWVDLTLEVIPDVYDPLAPFHMIVRAEAAERIDLQDIDFVNTRMVWTGEHLAIDRSVKRDTTLWGNTPSTAALVHPVNPTVHDTVTLELRWIGAGAPFVARHRLVPRPDGVTAIRFTFALRTDVHLTDMVFPGIGIAFALPPLPAGRYVIVQEASAEEHTEDLDVLLGREVPFTVAERRPTGP